MTLSARALTAIADGRTVLDRIDIDVPPGQIVAVAGPNGAGKSTLLRALAGIGAEAGIVRSGQVLLDGRLLDKLDGRARGRAIAYLPQERTVHWALDARRVVALGRLPHGGGAMTAADRAAVDRALADMDAAGFGARPVSRLSGGERARVLLARALAQDAPILVADEPTAGLDPAHALDLFGHFTRLASAGRSVVVALHDLSLARRFCQTLVLLQRGKVAASGPPGDVLTPPILADVYGIKAVVGEIDGIPVVVAAEPLTRSS